MINFFNKIYRKLLSVYYKLKNLNGRVTRYLYFHLPIKKNKIVFDNFGGNNFGGRPRIIAEELLKKDKNLDLVWLSYKYPDDLPKGIRWVKYSTNAAYKEWTTAKVWVDNIRNAKKPKKKERQFYIQTWHGEIGIKAVEKDVENFLDKKYVECAKQDSIATNLFTSTCKWCTDLIKTSFWYDGEIVPVAFNRDKNAEERKIIEKQVKNYFGINQTHKIILYAPTFRNENGISAYNLDYQNLINAARKKYNTTFCVLIRFHPNVLSDANKIIYSDNIINASAYPKVTDLILASTFVISDYSSVLFEAMKYNVFSLVFASDYKRYFSEERESYFDLKNLPSPFAENNEELTHNVLMFNEQDYCLKTKEFNDMAGYYDDENSLSSLADRIIRICGKD